MEGIDRLMLRAAPLLKRVAPMILLLAGGLAAVRPAATQSVVDAPLLTDPVSGCRFRLGPAPPGASAQWTGSCQEGLADGLGVLRVYRRGANGSSTISSAFYGEMAKGLIAFGVIDTEEGFLAGRFADGAYQDSDDFNTRLNAFRTASRAARAASARFAAEGNPGSAAFYNRIATRLDQQIE
jgi:hypothetical protein